MDIKKQLGKKIKEIRKAKNMTQEKLSEAIDIEPGSLCNIENGKYYPTAENLEKILTVLDIQPEDLYNFGYYADKNELLNEMLSEMKDNEKLLRVMYKFFNSVKYTVQ